MSRRARYEERLAQLPIPVGARRRPARVSRRRRRTPRPGVGHLVHRWPAGRRRDRPVLCLPDDFQQEPARRDDRRRFLHDGALRPRHRRLRHVHGLRHAAGQPRTGGVPQAGAGHGLSRHQLRRRCGHRVLDHVPQRRRGSTALHLPRQPGGGGPFRPADAAGPGRNPHARTDSGGRLDLQWQDRLLRPRRHLLLLPDRYGDDRHPMLGRGDPPGMSIGNGSRNTPAAGERRGIRGPGRTNGAPSTSTTAST